MPASVVSVAPPPPASTPTFHPRSWAAANFFPSSAPHFHPPPHQHGRTPSLPFSPSPARPTPPGNHPRRDRPWRSSSFVLVEASCVSGGDGAVARTKCLTENDLEELKGCLDLGFGFVYSEMPELCGMLPALELCYSMTRRFIDEQRAPGQEREDQRRS